MNKQFFEDVKILLKKIDIRIEVDWENMRAEYDETDTAIESGKDPDLENIWQQDGSVEESNILLIMCKDVITELLNENKRINNREKKAQKEVDRLLGRVNHLFKALQLKKKLITESKKMHKNKIGASK